jgi:hypothetical protein
MKWAADKMDSPFKFVCKIASSSAVAEASDVEGGSAARHLDGDGNGNVNKGDRRRPTEKREEDGIDDGKEEQSTTMFARTTARKKNYRGPYQYKLRLVPGRRVTCHQYFYQPAVQPPRHELSRDNQQDARRVQLGGMNSLDVAGAVSLQSSRSQSLVSGDLQTRLSAIKTPFVRQ